MKEVVAGFLVENGEILITKRAMDDKHGNKWEFPGGKIKVGETPEEGLKREIKEELRIDVEVGDYFGETIYHYEDGPVHIRFYWLRWIGGTIYPTSHDEVRWVKYKELEMYDFLPADRPIIEKLMSR